MVANQVKASNMSCHSVTELRLIRFLAQVSAVGVWGTPLEVASRAADIVVALPTTQLLKSRYASADPQSIHAKMLSLAKRAVVLLKWRGHVGSPYMSREKLLGRCEPCTASGAKAAPQSLRYFGDWHPFTTHGCRRSS
jgi:hypothetical protein